MQGGKRSSSDKARRTASNHISRGTGPRTAGAISSKNEDYNSRRATDPKKRSLGSSVKTSRTRDWGLNESGRGSYASASQRGALKEE